MGTYGKTRFELVETHSLESLISLCRERSLRMGRTRRAVAIAVVESDGRAFDFDLIWTRVRAIVPMSRSTVAFTLRKFRQIGLIREIEVS